MGLLLLFAFFFSVNCSDNMKRFVVTTLSQYSNMRGSRKFCQRGSSWLGDRESKYRYKRVIIGPPAKRHLKLVLVDKEACKITQ